MKFLNGQYYAEVTDHRYKLYPTENTILGRLEEPKSLRTQYQVQKITQIGRNQKIIRKNNDELEVKIYPKNKLPVIQRR